MDVCTYICTYRWMDVLCMYISGAGEMAQKLSTLTALPDNMSSVPRTHMNVFPAPTWGN